MIKEYFKTFYLDKERDIVVNLYKTGEDELTYIIETPNHNTGNLITNLAKISDKPIVKNEKDLKIIMGKMPASINSKNEDVYIFRLGKYRVANIYADGGVQLNGQIPAIIKTLMSQTKDYKLPIESTIVKSYILKNLKFKTDLHTHMNANLSPDCLIALGIKHQIKYPLYYIKKLKLKLSKEQEEKIYNQRKIIEKQFENSNLVGKYLDRKIDDNTFINFADFILNNLENARENLEKIAKSLVILKDGQAVFTNLEKLYQYRYVFAKGIESNEKIDLEIQKIEKIPIIEIKDILIKMLEDVKPESVFKNNNLRKDKLLWIAREYEKQGIKYVEIADTQLTKKGLSSIEYLEEIHEIMPKIEQETGVTIRFLFAIRRIPLTIINEDSANNDYLKENLIVLKAISKSPYVVGCDFIGEEINDITELKPMIEKIVEYVKNEDEGYTIRIHAGENDSLKDNVENSIKCVREALKPGQTMPRVRIGHGLYTADLNSERGKKLIQDIIEANAIMEFQITSNIRLNNLSELSEHPLKKYLVGGVKCVQGTDGCGFYGVDTIDEQLALQNILELSEEEFAKMRQAEDEVIEHSKKYFEEKSQKFKEFLNGRNMKEVLLEIESKYEQENKEEKIQLRIVNKIRADEAFKEKIVHGLPMNKMPIIIAGGSFNAKGVQINVEEKGTQILEKLVEKINLEKAYFVIGHKLKGYEEQIVEICNRKNKNIEIYAIIPKLLTKEEKERLSSVKLTGVCISIESEGSGIYKSFNYEIFERRNSIVIAFGGNSPISNLVQEAKNGKGKSKIYVNSENDNLRQKAKNLEGYVTPFNFDSDIATIILNENAEIM